MSSQMKVPEVIPADPIKIGIKMGSRSQMGPKRVPSGSQEGPMGPDPGHIWDALGPGSISTVQTSKQDAAAPGLPPPPGALLQAVDLACAAANSAWWW